MKASWFLTGVVLAACGNGSSAISTPPDQRSYGSGSSGLLGSGTNTPDASVPGSDPYSGPFRILVLSQTLGYHHDSIPACQQMLRDLGKCIDPASCAMTNDEYIQGSKPNSSFTVDISGANLPPAMGGTPGDGSGTCSCPDDLKEWTPANLLPSPGQYDPTENYQMIFFCSPTGTVFTSGGTNGMAGMQAIQAFIEGGGAYGGVHSASDFEDTGGFPFYNRNPQPQGSMIGGSFVDHNPDGTPGTVIPTPQYAMHPVIRGVPTGGTGPATAWATQDEWYELNNDISAEPGFQILATLNGPVCPSPTVPCVAQRPVIWVKEWPAPAGHPDYSGRVFYTVRGHNIVRFAEAPMRKLVHQGILWATHRLD